MMGDWTFFSNYGHVLVCLALDRDARLRDVAEQVGITERAVQKIVRDLQQEGFLEVSKRGRCNRYRINRRKSLRHDLESHCTVGKLLTLITRRAPEASQELRSEEGVARAGSDTAVTAQPTVEESPGQTAAPESVPPEKETAKRAKKPRKPGSPPDTRQQGSLF
jgi:hypothetical protein